MIAAHPQTQPQFFQTFAADPFLHVPWLIAQLPDDFCAQSLAFISKQPASIDKQQWRQWWSQEQKRLKQKMKAQAAPKSLPAPRQQK